MIRKIIFYKNHFTDFYSKQSSKIQEKIEFTLDLIRKVERVPVKFLKHIEGTKGLFEIRVKVGKNIFRVFCFFEKEQLVILINGFQKKSQKTPPKEIKLALKLMGEYYDEKKKK